MRTEANRNGLARNGFSCEAEDALHRPQISPVGRRKAPICENFIRGSTLSEMRRGVEVLKGQQWCGTDETDAQGQAPVARVVSRPSEKLDDEAHAVLVQAFVRWLRSKTGVATFCEVPYNYYGQRGIIDVLALVQIAPGAPRHGIVCELKPALRDLGAAIRQVRKAESYFQLPPALSERDPVILRYPLILEANEANYLTVVQYADVLDGVEVHLFSVNAALDNPFEQAWKDHIEKVPPQPVMWRPGQYVVQQGLASRDPAAF